MEPILVTGGAGYIGSHTVLALLDAGHEVVVLDDLSTGHRAALPDGVPLVVGDVADRDLVASVLDRYAPRAMIHFAGAIEAGESMGLPGKYWDRNVARPLQMLAAVVSAGCIPVVFSSTAAVYGDPERMPIAEDDPKDPVNVYGDTKLAFERILGQHYRAHGLRSISLRYFNACGAHPAAHIGEDHPSKSHLIELALLTALGKRADLSVFGTDYPTPDGSCVRDYVHVCDLADAHVRAVAALEDGMTGAYNVGVGRGFSVLEVLDAVDRVVGSPIPRRIAARRPGDPPALVADASRIRERTGWRPRYTDLDEIVATAWEWHRTHPHGHRKSAPSIRTAAR